MGLLSVMFMSISSKTVKNGSHRITAWLNRKNCVNRNTMKRKTLRKSTMYIGKVNSKT